jgi:predicted Fe-S protein YdhL (DUF1289 family)
MSSTDTSSPCINRCGLLNGICVGCGRTVGEIRAWTSMSNEEKKEAVEKSKTRLGANK